MNWIIIFLLSFNLVFFSTLLSAALQDLKIKREKEIVTTIYMTILFIVMNLGLVLFFIKEIISVLA